MTKTNRIAAALLSASLLVSAVGCSNESSSSSDSSGSSAAVTTAATTACTWEPTESEGLPKLLTSYTTVEMQKRAIINEGDTSRLVAAMKKAQSGEPITVATIGGSITQGSSASQSSQAYANRSLEWWLTAFPENAENVSFVNAGIGATDSYIGVHRVENDLLQYDPDVVIVEFAVNDTDADRNRKSYDSLVRRILSWKSNPAVILLFTTQEDGTSLQDVHSEIGYAYNLPMISYKNVVLPEIEAGTYTWKDISPDNIHPNTMGHTIIAELIYSYLNSVLARIDELPATSSEFTTAAITDDVYATAKLLDSSNTTPTNLGSFTEQKCFAQFPNDWKTTDGTASLTFEVDAKNIGIMYLRTTDGKSGTYHVLIDGKPLAVLNGDFTGGWGNYAESKQVYTSDETAKHTVEIKIAESSAAKEFAVLGLLVS